MKIGVVGFGNLGRYLVDVIQQRDDLELAFVWNRSAEAMHGVVDSKYILVNLDDFRQRGADLIVEVAHPCITEKYGKTFLRHANYMLGSPTVLASVELETELRAAAVCHGLYIPSGAFWGGEDIQKMADRGTLKGLKITMSKPPESLKVLGPLVKKKEQAMVENTKTVLFDGSVRELCPLAPNNVNTMAAAAIAAHNLGFDGTLGSIIADPALTDWHIVEIEVWGPESGGNSFHVHTVRRNPAQVGNVTGSATYASFLSSVLAAHGRGPGVHLC